jgi:hypothetical protein
MTVQQVGGVDSVTVVSFCKVLVQHVRRHLCAHHTHTAVPGVLYQLINIIGVHTGVHVRVHAHSPPVESRDNLYNNNGAQQVLTVLSPHTPHCPKCPKPHKPQLAQHCFTNLYNCYYIYL